MAKKIREWRIPDCYDNIRLMQRLSSLALIVALGACTAKAPNADICVMPAGLQGWNGASVKVTGVVEGGFEHGFALIDERCSRGGDLETSRDTINRKKMIRALHAIGGSVGITRMTLRAKITTNGGPKLHVTRYYGSTFEPMTAEQRIKFDRERGF